MPRSKKQPTEETESKANDLESFETKMRLNSITLRDLRWLVNMTVTRVLPKAYHKYRVEITLNRRPHEERIKEIEEEFDNTLLSLDKTSRKEFEKTMKGAQNKLQQLVRDCEDIIFLEPLKRSNTKAMGRTLLWRFRMTSLSSSTGRRNGSVFIRSYSVH